MAVDPARPELNSEAGPPETEARLLVHTRKEALKQLVMEHTGTRVTDAAHILNVSVSTVRRNLDILAAEGCVRRLHGGVVPNREVADGCGTGTSAPVRATVVPLATVNRGV
jgi:DeoR/GlpR family transcriptional regulator of sugar metabolism